MTDAKFRADYELAPEESGPVVTCNYCDWKAKHRGTVMSEQDIIDAAGVLRKAVIEHCHEMHPEKVRAQ